MPFRTLLLLFGVAVASPAVAEAARPNVLLIIADDLCWRDLGCMGNPDVKTPHIDRLAREGMTLRGLYTSSPTCSPTRHALYTGLYPIRSGAFPNHTRVDEGTKSVFHHLLERGYRVALQGKTHISPAVAFPYEFISKNPDDFTALREFITRDPSQPWFAVYASNDPHAPWTRGEKSAYDPEKLTLPPYLHDNPTTRRQLAGYYAEIGRLDAQVGECLKMLERTNQAAETLVLFVSEQGSSFPYGGKWSLYDNGIRVAGFARWTGQFEAGSASNALMQYVDVAPTLVELAGGDPMAIDTGCPDANGKRNFDGRSFLGVLLGNAERHRDYVFSQHTTVGVIGYEEPYPMRSVRDGRYKLIRNLAPENTFSIRLLHRNQPFRSWEEDAKSNPELAKRVEWLYRRPAEEFYDLNSDPYEMHNLAADPAYIGHKARLAAALDGWMRHQGDEGMGTELRAEDRQPRVN